LKLNPFRLNAIVLIPNAVNQIPTTGHCQEEVERTTVRISSQNNLIRSSNQSTEITVGSYDVVGLFFLSELVAVVL